MLIFVWYFLVTSWWSVCRLAFCSLYYNGLGLGFFVVVVLICFVCVFNWVVGKKR